MASTVTLKAHTARALAWYHDAIASSDEADKVFIAIGHTDAWDDEANPPVPAMTDEIEDLICYKAVEQLSFVVPDPTGTLDYRNQKYRMISESEVPAEGCRWIYCSCWLNYDEVPTNIGYRQLGLYSGVTRKLTVDAGKTVLLPNEVSNEGLCEVIINDTVTYRSSEKRERVSVLLEF